MNKTKKLLTVIGIAGLAMVSQAQTNLNVLQKIGQGVAALGTSTNWGFVAYGTMSNFKDKTGHRAYGGGLLGLYNLNSFVALGGGVDDLTGLKTKGQVTIMSANVQVQVPMHPLSLFSTNSFANNFTLTPYLYSGLGTPLGSTISSSAVSHEGEGIHLDLFQFSNWDFGVGFALIQRQNAGDYSGGYKDIVFAIHRPF